MSDLAVLVAIATYRRNASLHRLLDSLVEARGFNAHVIVVDNDPDGSARMVVLEHRIGAQYLVEPTPGIASARNRAMREFDARYAGIVFVDDDEWVAQDWYVTLMAFLADTGAEVVQGQVRSVVATTDGGPSAAAKFHQRPVPRSGTHLEVAATNNTYLSRAAWTAAGRPMFDDKFSDSGGSDTAFFFELHQSGAGIVYCAEVVAFEEVSPDRLTLRWVSRRYARNGAVKVRVLRKHGAPLWKPLGVSLAKATRSGPVIAASLLLGKGLPPRALSDLMSFLGAIATLLGYRFNEYGRAKDSRD